MLRRSTVMVFDSVFYLLLKAKNLSVNHAPFTRGEGQQPKRVSLNRIAESGLIILIFDFGRERRMI